MKEKAEKAVKALLTHTVRTPKAFVKELATLLKKYDATIWGHSSGDGEPWIEVDVNSKVMPNQTIDFIDCDTAEELLREVKH